MGLMSDLGTASDLANVGYDRRSAYATGLRLTCRTCKTFFVISLQIGNGNREGVPPFNTNISKRYDRYGRSDRVLRRGHFWRQTSPVRFAQVGRR